MLVRLTPPLYAKILIKSIASHARKRTIVHVDEDSADPYKRLRSGGPVNARSAAPMPSASMVLRSHGSVATGPSASMPMQSKAHKIARSSNSNDS